MPATIPSATRKPRPGAPARHAAIALVATTCGLGALAFALAGCASSPSLRRVITLQPQDEVVVRYHDSRNGLDQRLQNGSAGEARNVYSQGGDPSVKVVPDKDMQVLLDALATLGFYEHAAPTGHPGAKAMLAIDHNGNRRVWSRLSGTGTAEEIQAFNNAVTVFLNVFNNTLSYHTADTVTEVTCPACGAEYTLPGRMIGEPKCQACGTLLPASATRTRSSESRGDVHK